MEDKWSSEFPTETGWWWFYGYPWGNRSEDDIPRLMMLQANSNMRGGMIVQGNNSFIYKHECDGVFWKASPPPIPI